MAKFETPGKKRLNQWAKENGRLGSTQIARMVGVDQSMVYRWLKGESRPAAKYRPLLLRLAGIAESDWLLKRERSAADKAIAALDAEKGSAA